MRKGRTLFNKNAAEAARCRGANELTAAPCRPLFSCRRGCHQNHMFLVVNAHRQHWRCNYCWRYAADKPASIIRHSCHPLPPTGVSLSLLSATSAAEARTAMPVLSLRRPVFPLAIHWLSFIGSQTGIERRFAAYSDYENTVCDAASLSCSNKNSVLGPPLLLNSDAQVIIGKKTANNQLHTYAYIHIEFSIDAQHALLLILSHTLM